MKILLDRKGAILPQFAGILLIFVVIFECGFMYIRASIIAGGVKDAMRNGMSDIITDNSAMCFHGMREGNTGAYTIDAKGTLNDAATTGNLSDRLCRLLNIQNSGGVLVSSDSDGEHEYSISDIDVTVNNHDITKQSDFTVNVSAKLKINMPMSLPPIQIPVSTDSQWAEKF